MKKHVHPNARFLTYRSQIFAKIRIAGTLLLMLWMFFPAFLSQTQAQCYQAPNYCTAITATNNANYQMGIQNVTLGTPTLANQINNTTNGGTGTQIYFDYSNLILRAAAGDSVYWSIRVGSSNSTTFRIYIDYNNDGVFATVTPELVYTSAQITGNTIVNGNFVLPTTLTAGTYRIRIASDGLTNIPSPCGPITYSAEYEDYTLFVPSSTPDVMSGKITQPAAAIVGNNTVAFTVTNISTTTITSLDIYYQLDADIPVSQSLSSISIAPGATYTATFTTQVALPATGTYFLRTWTGTVNTSAPNTPANDTICTNIVTYCSGPLSGTYTINPGGSGTSNFTTWGAADSALMSCGVSGPTNFNVTSGTYNEGIVLTAIPGASAINRIVFNGNGSTLAYACNASNLSIIRLQGVKHVTFDSVTLRSTNVSFGWGVHFFNNCDSNTFRNSIIDLSNVTTTTSTNSAGIVFSNSLTSPTTTGGICVGNTIQNNYIKGNPTAGSLYYGIVGFPSTSATTYTGNRFIRNTIENFYVYGIYWGNGNRTLWRGNLITRPNKTTVTTTYGFYFTGAARSDTIDGNRITNLFGASPTNTNTTYIAYAINYSGTVAEPNIWTNNLVYDVRGDGPLYGLYFLTSFNNKILNNTFLFDNISSTNGSATTYGLYWTGNTSTSSTLDFRNNIISFTRTGASTKYALFTTGAWTAGLTMNKNDYFSNSPNYNLASYVGVNYANLPAWKLATFLPDQNSIDFAPNFLSPSTGNFSPQDGAFDGAGDNVITIVPYDFTGAPRSLPMDIGAFEATPIPLDAAMAAVVLPTAPYVAGTQSFSCRIRNAGTTTISTATINWSVNGVAQTPASFSGTLAGGAVSGVISLGTASVAANTLYDIQVTVSAPNGLTDPNPANNSMTGTTAAQVSGILTINQNASGTGIIKSFTDLGRLLGIGGLGGAVTANVATGSGPYDEQVFFSAFPGSSATNTVTINGNGEVLRFNNLSAGSLGILNLTGATYVYLNNLTIRSLNASYGIGIIFTAGANFNRVQNCTIDIGSVTGSSSSAGIAFTSSLGSPTTNGSNNGNNNLIENNLITGNSSGGPYYGISYIPTTSSNAANTNNIIRNNNIRDFTVYGFYIMYSAGTMFSGNTIWRPTKTSPTTHYGFYCVNGLAQDTFDNNIIKSPYKMLETTTGTFYGFYLVATNTQATRPLIIRNNQMYDLRFNGAMYGFFQNSASNIRYYNNSVIIDHPTSTSTGVTYMYYNSGTPTTTTIRNNIWYLNRGGNGNKFVYYLATTGAGYVINNNVVHVKQVGTNNFFGYYAANIATFAAWRAVNTNAYDQNSVSADPMFRLNLGPEYYMPGSDSVNNIGFATTDVPRDILGNLRSSTTPDPGPYEFSVPAVDAALTRVAAPVSPLSLGTQNVNVVLKSFGPTSLYSANIGWEVNGASQTSASWFGSLNYGDSNVYTVGTYSFSNPGFYRIKAWSYAPNGLIDSFPLNDTVNLTVCTPLSGYFTVDPSMPVSDTNFQSITSFVSTMQTCGVSGPIFVQVAPGTYNGQLTFTGSIPGISAINNVTISGTDSSNTKIVHDGSVQRATILMNGAKHFTFRNLTIEATALSGGGYGILFTAAADSNKVIQSTVRVAVLGSAISTFAPILSSANLLNPNNAGNNANYLLVDSCRLVGGYYAINLYNNTSPKANGNIVRNCDLIQPYYYGGFFYWQNQIQFTNNRIVNIGNNINQTAYSIYVYQSDNGVRIMKNQVSGQMGGYGLYMAQNYGSPTNRNIVANNMIQLGTASFTSYGIYDAGNTYTDIAHNAVHNTSGDASYVSCAIYFNYANTGTSNNLRMVNNVFSSPNGAMALWCPNTTVLSASNMFINNNAYYSPSSYPFRIVNTIYQALGNYRTALGAFISGVDTSSVWVQPSFFSTTNLRSITPQLDSIGFVIPTVTDDIDGNPRSTNAPDAGVYEFARPSDDAGVIAILQPVSPVTIGQNEVKVVIRNFGLSTLTSANVSYSVDTMVRTQPYFGTVLPGESDTVTFTATSGPGGTNQRFNYTGGAVVMKAYTTSPNGNADLQTLNDTTILNFCAPLNGVYTIDPSGSGTSNFVSFGDVVNRLTCGGVAGSVVFNVASGTYTGQIDLTTIIGTNDTTRITFKSATGNAGDVILTSNNSNSLDNFTLRLRGVSYVNFERMTLRNANTTFARVVSINKFPSNNTNTNNVTFRNCVLEGMNTTSTADQYSVVFGPGGDNATNLSFISNNIRYGSYGIYIGGQNIINLFSPGIVIDSNTFFQPYWAGVYLLNRNNPKIRANFFDGNPSYGYYNIFLSSVSGDAEVNANNIQNVAGYYAIYLAQCNYYGEVGVAKVTNNVVNMTSNNTQYGIYFVNSSSTYFINNTVRCNAATAGTYAFYFSGNTTSATTPQIVATNNIRVFNNIFWSQLGYATYFANFNAVSGTPQCNNNLYYSGGTNFAYINGLNYAPTTIYNTFRNVIHSGSDRRSLLANIAFTSNTFLRPLLSDAHAWAASGRGQQTMFVNTDITGAARSTQVETGAPDIGAYEFVPTSTPVSAALVGSIGGGNTQSMIVYGDTIGKIVWGFSGSLPTAINATYHTGALVNDPTNSGNNPGSHFMDVFWKITATGGAFYNYDLSLIFDPNMLGTVPSMSDIKLAKKVTGVNGSWTHYGYTLTSVDSINYNFGVIGLSDFSEFTGTSDIAPLPITLSRFEAVREQRNAFLYWNTASEKNSAVFEIQRAEDGVNFEAIGKVSASGNTVSNTNYLFTDEGAADRFAGKHVYYRLRMIDRDGSFEYSPTRMVDFSGSTTVDVKVFPNPFSDNLTIRFGEISGSNVLVEIHDLTGKIWYSGSQVIHAGNPEFTVQALNKLNGGIYLIRVNNGNEVITRKLIKE